MKVTLENASNSSLVVVRCVAKDLNGNSNRRNNGNNKK